MNQASPHMVYRSVQSQAALPRADPHTLIRITLQELSISLSILAKRPAPKSRAYRTHLSRALTALYILQSSLDFGKGGEIAKNLYTVYEFCRLQVLALSAGKPQPRIEDAAKSISEILSAWQAIE